MTDSQIPRKRPASQWRRNQRNKQRRINTAVTAGNLSTDQSGYLVSCTPHHEDHAFRDAATLLQRLYDSIAPSSSNPEKSTTTTDALESELADLRTSTPPFARVDPGVQGAVFVRPRPGGPSLETVVEAALREARALGNPGSRHCIRLLPVHASCHADVPAVVRTTARVARDFFPKAPAKFAVIYRARLNNGAKRDVYIPAIADAVHQLDKNYTVDLTKPDVVLLVEILKTSCCIGTFRHFYELAKMNLREAACPSGPPTPKGEKKEDNVTSAAGCDVKEETETKPNNQFETSDKTVKDVENGTSTNANPTEPTGPTEPTEPERTSVLESELGKKKEEEIAIKKKSCTDLTDTVSNGNCNEGTNNGTTLSTLNDDKGSDPTKDEPRKPTAGSVSNDIKAGESDIQDERKELNSVGGKEDTHTECEQTRDGET